MNCSNKLRLHKNLSSTKAFLGLWVTIMGVVMVTQFSLMAIMIFFLCSEICERQTFLERDRRQSLIKAVGIHISVWFFLFQHHYICVNFLFSPNSDKIMRKPWVSSSQIWISSNVKWNDCNFHMNLYLELECTHHESKFNKCVRTCHHNEIEVFFHQSLSFYQ